MQKSSTQDMLRDWYETKSRDCFASTSYELYKDEQKIKRENERKFVEFERQLLLERERLSRDLQNKMKQLTLSVNPTSGLHIRSKILNDAIAKTMAEKIIPSTRYCEPSMILKPEDFCSPDSNIEELYGINRNSKCTDLYESLSGDNELPSAIATCNDDSINSTSNTLSFASNSNFPSFARPSSATEAPLTSTPIKSGDDRKRLPNLSMTIIKSSDKQATGQKIAAAPNEFISTPSEALKDIGLSHDSDTFRWIDHFSKYQALKLSKVLDSKDPRVENIRAQLSKSIIAQINISTKKQATNAEIGATLAFFYDLLEGKPIKSWDETNTIQMDVKNSNLVEAIMETIVVRYQEQVKWDSELVHSISFILASICLKFKNFYRIFCTVSVRSIVLMSFNIGRIVDKIQSLSTDEAAHWIPSEQSLFRLFCSVQLLIKPSKEKPNGSNKGPEFLKLFFNDVVEAQKPTVLATLFFTAEMLTLFLQQMHKSDRKFLELVRSDFIPQIRRQIISANWEPQLDAVVTTYKLNAESRLILKSRNDYLNVLLTNAVEKFEASTL